MFVTKEGKPYNPRIQIDNISFSYQGRHYRGFLWWEQPYTGRWKGSSGYTFVKSMDRFTGRCTLDDKPQVVIQDEDEIVVTILERYDKYGVRLDA